MKKVSLLFFSLKHSYLNFHIIMFLKYLCDNDSTVHNSFGSTHS